MSIQPGAIALTRTLCGESSVAIVRIMPIMADFAAAIRDSKFYAGYDSAGGHAASVYGVPSVSIFAGSVSDRMFERWKPSGRGQVTVIRADDYAASEILAQAAAKLHPQP